MDLGFKSFVVDGDGGFLGVVYLGGLFVFLPFCQDLTLDLALLRERVFPL